jgi:hypothetical protein
MTCLMTNASDSANHRSKAGREPSTDLRCPCRRSGERFPPLPLLESTRVARAQREHCPFSCPRDSVPEDRSAIESTALPEEKHAKRPDAFASSACCLVSGIDASPYVGIPVGVASRDRGFGRDPCSLTNCSRNHSSCSLCLSDADGFPCDGKTASTRMAGTDNYATQRGRFRCLVNTSSGLVDAGAGTESSFAAVRR